MGPKTKEFLQRKTTGTNLSNKVKDAGIDVKFTRDKDGTISGASQSGGKPGEVISTGGANKGVPTKDTKFATDKLLNKNRTDGKTYSASDAKRMEKSFNQRLQSEPDFDEFDNVPVVNSKGQKVKKIPGTNSVSGGTKKQMDSMNQNMANF